jgi:hypothetical protein
VTAPLRYRERIPPLSRTVWRILLGQQPRWAADGRLIHAGISTWMFLVAKALSPIDEERYIAMLWREHRTVVQTWHVRRYPGRRAPANPDEMAASYIRRHGHRTTFKQWLENERKRAADYAAWRKAYDVGGGRGPLMRSREAR